MIRRKVSLLLAILMVITTMTVGFTPTAAGSDDGITTDTPAPYDEYEEIRKLKQKDQSDPENNEPQVIQRESLYTKTVDNGDGTKTLEVYGEPVRYEAGDGSVKDISLTPVAKGKGFTTGGHRLGISFPEKADSGISLNTGKHVITATPVAENGTAVKTASACLSDTDSIVYRSDPKTSYEYNITYSGYKENIVVSEYTGQTDYYFRIETDGLLLVASEGDPARGAGLELKDTEGRTAARIGNIIVFSSDNRNNTFGSIGFETVTEGEEYIIQISVPKEYLSDPATRYPIYIDPTITVAYDANNSSTWNDIEDITVNQNQAADPPNYGTLYVGKAGPDYGAMRAVMRFPELELYGISPNSITSATVNLRDLMCYGFTLQVDCYGYGGTLPSTAFTTSNMTWSAVYNTMQYYESNNAYRSTNYVSYNNGYYNSNQFWYEFNVLPVVQNWAQGRNAGTLAKTDQAIVFKATDAYEQSTSEQYVCFGSYDVSGGYKPKLSIVYYEDDEYDSFYSSTNDYYRNSYYSENNIYVYNDDGLQFRSNCYGYAFREFYALELFPYSRVLPNNAIVNCYLQQPGEFADKENGLTLYYLDGTPWRTIYCRSDLDTVYQTIWPFSWGWSPYSSQEILFFLKQLIQADAATLGYSVTEFTGETLPDASTLVNSRMVALAVSTFDYHFYMQHSDNTWSHKPGVSCSSDECLCNDNNNVKLTNSTIIDHANDGIYSGGEAAFFIITKNAVIDNPHLDGTYAADGPNCFKTSLVISDNAGNTFFSSKGCGNLSVVSGDCYIDYPGDTDWFAFTPLTNDTYDFDFSHGNFSLTVALFDEDRNMMYRVTGVMDGISFSLPLNQGKKYRLRVNSPGQTAYEFSRWYSFSVTY